MRRCDVVHADETGWRVNTVNGWLWVFSNQNLTVYTIRTGEGARGADVPKDILGPDFDGILIVDGSWYGVQVESLSPVLCESSGGAKQAASLPAEQRKASEASP
ncbi:MAG: transposase, partial [Planctomycetes bacterium]|nr:transposase [Planctomycetota bacterium]